MDGWKKGGRTKVNDVGIFLCLVLGIEKGREVKGEVILPRLEKLLLPIG